jgi:hypothetical protein
MRVAALAFLAVVASGCAATAPGPIGPEELSLNVAQFIAPSRITGIARQSPDNFRIVERVRFDGGGVVETLHLHFGFFNHQGEAELSDPAAFDAWARRLLTSERVTDRLEVREVRHERHRSLGFVALFAGEQPGRRCILARAGYRMPTSTLGDNDEQRVTTVLTLGGCGMRLTTEPFMPLLTRVERMDDATRERLRQAAARRT